MDTAAPLSEKGDDGLTADVVDEAEIDMTLSVDQFDPDGSSCQNSIAWEESTVAKLSAWFDWYTELWLPARLTCLSIYSGISAEEADDAGLESYGDLIACSALSSEISPSGGQLEYVELVVTCGWYREGDCEGCD